MVSEEQEQSRLFRYYPGDFGELTVKVIHMDLVFDVHDQHTRTTALLTAEVLGTPIQTLALNANDLEILSVSCDAAAVTTDYHKDKNLLSLTFD
ncbi:MAG: DUF3458 domain-containing protein, partial [Methanomicrobiales archaeon]|nr:DUF3458 domain-containing protein [Methanomicrobiales archaeon]